ncbi:MAG: sigma-70 family RNA polymerase sigma factor [Gammaproteobacteria bacterium]|nr:sigma-70 family RNA polymerase sigma factor [Gammaproteobacteria bacterium]
MGPPADNSTELQILLDRANEGEPEAYEELVERAAQRLGRLAHRMLGSFPHVRRWEETDDVQQAALLRLYNSLAEVRPDSTKAFFGLAATQIRRTLIDLARHYYGVYGHGAKHHTDPGRRAADDSGGVLANAGFVQDGPNDLLAWSEFHEAVEKLPEEEREAFSSIWYGGLSQREAADLFGVSERTMIRRMNRARIGIHQALGGKSPLMDGLPRGDGG